MSTLTRTLDTLVTKKSDVRQAKRAFGFHPTDRLTRGFDLHSLITSAVANNTRMDVINAKNNEFGMRFVTGVATVASIICWMDRWRSEA
jgi:hypothetical protein